MEMRVEYSVFNMYHAVLKQKCCRLKVLPLDVRQPDAYVLRRSCCVAPQLLYVVVAGSRLHKSPTFWASRLCLLHLSR